MVVQVKMKITSKIIIKIGLKDNLMIIRKLHSKKKKEKFSFFSNFSRHLKWNETKFNGTLNDTRFGLKARVSRISVLSRFRFSGGRIEISGG